VIRDVIWRIGRQRNGDRPLSTLITLVPGASARSSSCAGVSPRAWQRFELPRRPKSSLPRRRRFYRMTFGKGLDRSIARVEPHKHTQSGTRVADSRKIKKSGYNLRFRRIAFPRPSAGSTRSRTSPLDDRSFYDITATGVGRSAFLSMGRICPIWALSAWESGTNAPRNSASRAARSLEVHLRALLSEM
jgi:hypothetical protein